MTLFTHLAKVTVSVLAASALGRVTYELSSMAGDFASNQFTLWNSKKPSAECNPNEKNSPSFPNQ